MTEEEEDIRRKRDLEILDAAVRQLNEHFDSVQIFCTRLNDNQSDGTIRVSQGIGNWYSRIGHVREFIIHQDEITRCEARDTHKDEE